MLVGAFSRKYTFVMITMISALVAFIPRAAVAYGTNVSGSFTSEEAAANCIKAGGYWSCIGDVLFFDPPVVGVTSMTLTVNYDSLRYSFDPTQSGPMGVLSQGGDAPAPNPGVGTQPLELLASSGFAAGAPLPGSTLTYNDSGGVVTVNYQLANPITTGEDINAFRLYFNLIHPIQVDISKSTVTYSKTGVGGDFTQSAFSCTTSDGLNSCGSNYPSSGVTITYSIPEPSTWALMLLGFAGVGFAGYRSRKSVSIAA